MSVEFVKAALDYLPQAEDLLSRHPDLAGESFHAALVLGDVPQLRAALAEDADRAKGKGGPNNWEPLLYVCFSRFARGSSERAHQLTEAARLLLSYGADPNSSYIDERWQEWPLSCLYGATGLNNNPELGRALLDAGARPNDSESLYHSTEHSDLACLRLLLERGASAANNNVLKHMLDFESFEGARLLLAAGADPNQVNQRGETALHWAVWRGRGAEIIGLLLDFGANINAKREDGRTAYALAVQSGQTATASLLESRGADLEIPELDRLLGSWAVADPADLGRLVANSGAVPLPAEYERLLPEFAANHRTGAVRALLAAGFPVNYTDDSGATPLHWACWHGYPDLVELLIARGASLRMEDKVYHAAPAGWFAHGKENSNTRDGDYPEVERLLEAAKSSAPLRG